MPMQLENRYIGETMVVSLSTHNLDASNAPEVKSGMLDLAQRESFIVLDLSGVEFVDSSGLGALLSSLRALRAKGGNLGLCCLAKPVRVLIELVRMDRVFPIYDTAEEAVAGITQGN